MAFPLFFFYAFVSKDTLLLNVHEWLRAAIPYLYKSV